MAKKKEKEEEKDEKDVEEGKEGKEKDKGKEKDAKKEPPKKDAKDKGEDAEGEEGGEGAEGAPKTSKKKKLIIIAAAVVLLLIAGGAGLYFSGMLSHGGEEKVIVAIGPDGKPVEKPVYYTLPEFLVNLNAGGKQTSFLKTTVILEMPRQGDVPIVEANLPRLLDSYNTYLRELRASDLSGSAGIQRLREELLLRGNKVLTPTKINDILFKDIIVQ